MNYTCCVGILCISIIIIIMYLFYLGDNKLSLILSEMLRQVCLRPAEELRPPSPGWVWLGRGRVRGGGGGGGGGSRG